jgi:hypothetical protein
MGQKMVRFAQLGAARSRQDESIEVGEVGSKRPSSGCNNGVHFAWWGGLICALSFDWERGDFRRGHSLHNDKVRRAPRWTGQIQAGRRSGRGGRLMELGVHAGEWSPVGSSQSKKKPQRTRRAASSPFVVPKEGKERKYK